MEYTRVDTFRVIEEDWGRDESGLREYQFTVQQLNVWVDENGDPLPDPDKPDRWSNIRPFRNTDRVAALRQTAEFIVDTQNPTEFVSPRSAAGMLTLAEQWLAANPEQ